MSTPTTQTSMPTTISIPEELADELYDRKGRGESYADVIFRLIEQAEESTDSGDDTPPADDPAPTATDTRPEEPAPEETGPDSFEDLVDAVGEATLPGSGQKLTERKEAFQAVVTYLREHGTATPSEFQSNVYPDHQAWYDDGKEPSRSWWKNAMYPALAELAERSEKIAKADQTGEWRWQGDELRAVVCDDE